MGCGALGAPTSDYPTIESQLDLLFKEKTALYEDRLTILTEVQQMKQNVSDTIRENEYLKMYLDTLMARSNPQVFGDNSSQEEVIANWVEMDLRDGDVLLEALGQMHQASREEVATMLKISADLKQQDAPLSSYCNYFSQRFELFNTVWKRAVHIQFELENTYQRLKSEAAQTITALEGQLGKRSEAAEDLRARFRDLAELKHAELLLACQAFEQRVTVLRNDLFNRKLEEKETERQRVIAWYDTEIARIRRIHGEEIAQKDQEREALRTALELQLATEKAQAQADKQAAEDLAGLRLSLMAHDLETYLVRASETAAAAALSHRAELAHHQTCFQAEKAGLMQVIEAAKADHAAALLALEDKQKTEIAALEGRRKTQVAQLQAEIAAFQTLSWEQISFLGEDLLSHSVRSATSKAIMEEKHGEEVAALEKTIAEMKESHQKEVEKLTAEFNEERASLRVRIERRVKEYQKLQVTSENDIATVTRRAFEERQSLLAVHGRDLAEKDRAIEDLKEALEREGNKRSLEVRQATEGRDDQLQQLINEHKSELTKMRRKLETESEKHELVLRKLQQQHDQFLASLSEKTRSEIEQFRNQHAQELAEKDEVMKKAQSESQQYIADMMERYRADISEVLAKSQEDLKQKDDILAQNRAEFMSQIDALISKHAKEMADLRDSQSKELASKEVSARQTELSHQDTVQQLMDKYREDLERLRLSHQAEIAAKDALLQAADVKLAQQTEQFRQDLAALRQAQQEELQRKEEVLEKTRAENRATLEEIREKNTQEIRQIRSQSEEILKAKEAMERKLEAEHKAATSALMDKFREDLDKSRLQYQTDLQLKDQKLTSTIQETQAQISNILAKSEQDIANLRENHASESQRKDQLLEKAMETHRAEVRALLAKSASEAEDQQRQFTEELRARTLEIMQMRGEYEARQKDLLSKHSQEVSELRKAHSEALEASEAAARKSLADYDLKLAEIVDKHRADLLAAREVNHRDSMRKDEHTAKLLADQKQQIATLVDKYTKELAQLRTQHAEEVTKMEEAQRLAVRESEEKLAATIERMATEQEALRRKQQEELETKHVSLASAQSDFDQKLREITLQHVKAMRDLNDANAAELQKRETAAATAQKEQADYVNQLMDKFRADLATLRSNHKDEITRKDALIAQLQSDHQSNSSEIIDKYTQEITDLRRNQEEDLAQRDLQLNTLVKSYETRISDLVEKQRKELAALRDSQAEALKLKNSAEDHLIARYESQLKAIQAENSQEMASFKRMHAEEVQKREEQIRESERLYSLQTQALVDKFVAESAVVRHNFEQEIRGKDEFIEKQRGEYEVKLDNLRLNQLTESKTREAQQVLEIADLKRGYELAISEYASSLERFLGDLVARTELARSNHSESRAELLQTLPLVNTAAVSDFGGESPSVEMEEEGKEGGGSAFIKAFDILQRGLYADKQEFEGELARDLAIIRGLGVNIVEMKETTERLKQDVSKGEKRGIGLKGDLESRNQTITLLTAEKDQLAFELTQAKAEIMSCLAAIQSLEGTVTALSHDISQAGHVKTLHEQSRDALVAEVESCRQTITMLEAAVAASKGLSVKEQEEIKAQLQRATEDLTHRDMKIKELAENLRDSESQFIIDLRRKSVKSLIVRLISRMTNSKRKAFSVFRIKRRQPSPQPQPSPQRESLEQDTTEAERLWSEEQRSLLEGNLLLDIMRKNGKSEKPLSLNQVLKFFEEVMDRKFEMDVADMKAHRAPKAMQEFLLEYLTRTFGLRKLAVKMVCQLMPALLALHREQQPEVVLFCRLLHLINPSPIPLPLAIFLTKVRVEFSKYAKTYQAEHSQSSLVTRAYLVDIFAYVYALFEDDFSSGTALLRRLRPEALPLDQYVLFKVCNKMAILSMNSEEVFAAMDADKGGEMSEDEFISGVQKVMQLWIEDGDLKAVYRLMAPNGTLTRTDFIRHLNFKQYLEKCRSELFTVSKTAFLTALAEVYSAKQVRDAAWILSELGGVLDVDEGKHGEIVRRVKPGASAEEVQAVWRKVKDQTGTERVTAAAYVKAVLRAALLPQSVFCKFHPALEDLTLWAELSESEDFRSDSSGPKLSSS